MSDHILTVVIESDDGSPIDVEELRAVLREAGFSANSWMPGDHLIVEIALQQAADTLGRAHRMVQALRAPTTPSPEQLVEWHPAPEVRDPRHVVGRHDEHCHCSGCQNRRLARGEGR